MNLNDYQFETEEEKQASRGLMDGFSNLYNEKVNTEKQKDLLINFVAENGLEGKIIDYMKEKTNEGISYWYEKAAKDFLECDTYWKEANILHDEYEITKEAKLGYLD